MAEGGRKRWIKQTVCFVKHKKAKFCNESSMVCLHGCEIARLRSSPRMKRVRSQRKESRAYLSKEIDEAPRCADNNMRPLGK